MTVNSGKMLGEIVRFHRKRSGLTQLELATMAGIGKTTVFDIENGKTTVQLDKLLALLEVLNVKMDLHSMLMDQYEKSKNIRS